MSGSTASSPPGARPSARTPSTSSWTAPRASGPAGCATASSPPAWPKTCAATPASRRTSSRTTCCPPKFAHLPDGMLPMCYPADHNDGVFIPNWALWFVVELEEYLARSGDRETVDALRPRVLRLFDYFKKFRNEDGLLEKLESWVFVEWSAANSLRAGRELPLQHALRQGPRRRRQDVWPVRTDATTPSASARPSAASPSTASSSSTTPSA